MSSHLRTLTAAVAVAAAAVFAPSAFSVGALGAQGTAGSGGSDRARFVGAFELVATEARDSATGQWSRPPNFNSNGYIIYGDTGHMGVHIMPKVRPRFTSNPPTGEEAQAALRGYTAYFGSFSVNGTEGDRSVVHHRLGNLNPGAVGDVRYFYDFELMPNGSERLILTAAPAAGGGRDKATQRIVWQRMPDAPLSAEAKKFIGFWRLLYTDTARTKDGKEVFHANKVETRAGTSYIIYAASGHMMVHLMNREGRMKFAGAEPTPAEALAAYRSYTGYFGRFITYEHQKPPFVYHSQQGSNNPGGYSEQKRFYQFTGDVLRLGTPPSLNAEGELTWNHLYWQRQGPIAAR